MKFADAQERAARVVSLCIPFTDERFEFLRDSFARELITLGEECGWQQEYIVELQKGILEVEQRVRACIAEIDVILKNSTHVKEP